MTFSLKKISKTTTQNERGVKNENSNPLGPNSTKFCIHNLWTSRELEMGWKVTGGLLEGPRRLGVVESDRGRAETVGCGGE